MREGRLEVLDSRYYQWGTVCNDRFTDSAARVVCYELGYGRIGWFSGNLYGAGTGRIWLDNVQCNGTETYISYCRHNGWGRHNCAHSQDVSVSCNIVRLVGGPSPREGRLEVYYRGTWGTVCDDYFTDSAARVVCYELGYQRIGWFMGNRYGAGSGRIWLDNVRCTGTETNITNCRHRSWGVHDCKHSEDVSVSCNKVRLVGGPSPREGRLEVYYSRTWGTVCDDGLSDSAASVVCYMLGYGRYGRFVGNRYGAGSGQIWLDNVRCSGTETNIGDCRHNSWGRHNCAHSEDVSVSCNTLILVGGPSPREGRLEVYNGIWGTVCDDGFTDSAARVVCYELGYQRIGRFIGNRYGSGSGRIWLDKVNCTGTETNIGDCQHNGWGLHNCEHSEDVSVSCNTLRLVGGPSPRKGRLEVYYNERWGTVCDDSFSHSAARVVCYQLGYGRTGQFIGNRYGSGSGRIWLDKVNCTGTETNIGDCQHNGWSLHNCRHSQDVSVSCKTARLVGGPGPREGRLKVYHNGTWGTVCDDHFNYAAAKVVCYMIADGGIGHFIGNRYGAGRRTIWLDNVQCNGTENDISYCRHNGWGSHNCTHSQDVSVSCTAVRLVG